MAIEIIVPRLGWSMDEGKFSQWLKQEGDLIQEGDQLFELESDKAVQQVESFDSGVLRILPDGPKPGETIKVGQRLGYLCKKGELAPFEVETPGDVSSGSRPAAPTQMIEAPTGAPAADRDDSPTDGRPAPTGPTPSVGSPSVRRLARELGVDIERLSGHQALGRVSAGEVRAAASGGNHAAQSVIASPATRVRVSPRAARAAAKLGVNLASVAATGTTGRIRERDVLAAAAQEPADAPPKYEEQQRDTSSPVRLHSGDAPSSLRRTIAARMLSAAQQTASVTLTASADATELVNVRKQYQSQSVERSVPIPSYNDLLVKLSAAALEQHPEMLGQWSDGGILVPDGIHIAVAVDTPSGLLTPVLRDVPGMTLSEISDKLTRLIGRARDRRLTADELRGGTFTLSNLGGYRVDAFTPLLNLPQSAILGIGRIAARPAVVEGKIDVRELVTLSLTFDHRVVDGAAAAALLTTICDLVERPMPVLLT